MRNIRGYASENGKWVGKTEAQLRKLYRNSAKRLKKRLAEEDKERELRE